MKKAAIAFLVAAGVLASLLLVFGIVGTMRNEKVRQQPPLTDAELQALVKSGVKAGPANTDASADTGSAGPVVATAAAPPHPLNRVATDAQRRQMFMRTTSSVTDRLMVAFGSSPFGAVADAVAVAYGHPTGESWACAMCNLIRGDWKDAKAYLQEFLRTSNDAGDIPRTCAYLAWLEDNPEVAARYAEIASSGGDGWSSILCADLALATESTELFDYCTKQGRSLVPDFENKLKQYSRFTKTNQDGS